MFQGWKTYIGIAIMLISFLAQHFGYTVNVEALKSAIDATLNDAGVVIGGAIAIYGRLKAYKTFLAKATK